jgi:lipopolysaccharide export system protein LptA
MGIRLALAVMLCAPGACLAQAIDLSHGGPVGVTAAGGIDWDQAAQTVTAHEDARATRGAATVTADRLIAHYRKKAAAPGAPAAKAPPPTPVADGGAAPATEGDTGGNEIYRLEADGKVHIFTATDQAWGDHAVYDIDQAVMVLTGHGLRLTTPSDVLTARDAMEYWSAKHMSVGRGDATVTSNDGRRIRADTLVGYSVDPNAPAAPGAPKKVAPPPPKPGKQQDDVLGAGGKLQRVEAFGHVQIHTATEIVTGDRGVYVPDTGLARVVGHVHITRGDNQLNGAAAVVNMKTGLATLTQAPGGRVQGLVVPNGSGDAAPGGAESGDAKKKGAPKSGATTSKGQT